MQLRFLWRVINVEGQRRRSSHGATAARCGKPAASSSLSRASALQVLKMIAEVSAEMLGECRYCSCSDLWQQPVGPPERVPAQGVAAGMGSVPADVKRSETGNPGEMQ
jgi:hypothetical protein